MNVNDSGAQRYATPEQIWAAAAKMADADAAIVWAAKLHAVLDDAWRDEFVAVERKVRDFIQRHVLGLPRKAVADYDQNRAFATAMAAANSAYSAHRRAKRDANGGKPGLRVLDGRGGNPPPPPAAAAGTITAVIKDWRTEGPLIHEPTGLARFDELTGGGPVYGTRIYATGQPDAGKTLFELSIAHTYAKRGVLVGLLAVDEEAGDLTTRFAQRLGYTRKACELRDPMVLDEIEKQLQALPLRFYDSTWTIEAAAADLAKLAAARKDPRMMLGIDSLQTVHCDADRTAQRELSEMQAVTARVQAIRKVATQYKLIAMATSEMSRGAYRKADPSDLTSTMAASKHSGAVEYSARVLLGLRSVKGESDLIEVDVAKNKLGPAGDTFHLKIDRATQSLWEVGYDAPPAPNASERRLSRVADDAERLKSVLAGHPGMTTRELHSRARAAIGLGKDAVDAALAHLGDAVTITDGPRRSKLIRLCDCAD